MCTLNLAGNAYDERRLLAYVMKHMRSPTRYTQPRWAVVRDMFGVGSTVAHALCREFDLDPDDLLTK